LIYLHLGAHKTATTYLQDLMGQNQGRIAQSGRAYWLRKQIRGDIEYGFRILAKREMEDGLIAKLAERMTGRSEAMEGLRQKLSVPMDAMISEENILGHPYQSLDGRLYPNAKTRLRHFREATGIRDCEIFLCVREYSTFLSSLFVEALRHGYFASISDFKTRCGKTAGQWLSLVQDIHSVFPGSKIVVWQYEDFVRMEPLIVKRLTGLELGDLDPLATGNVKQGASAMAVEQQCAQASTLSSPERVLRMAANEERFPPARFPQKFNPWSEAEATAMRSCYVDDVTAIDLLEYVEHLTP